MHPALFPVYKHIQEKQASFITRLMDYVRHPSISTHNIGIREVSEILVEMLTKIGLDTHTISASGHPMLIGRWEQAPGTSVLKYGVRGVASFELRA